MHFFYFPSNIFPMLNGREKEMRSKISVNGYLPFASGIRSKTRCVEEV